MKDEASCVGAFMFESREGILNLKPGWISSTIYVVLRVHMYVHTAVQAFFFLHARPTVAAKHALASLRSFHRPTAELYRASRCLASSDICMKLKSSILSPPPPRPCLPRGHLVVFDVIFWHFSRSRPGTPQQPPPSHYSSLL